MKIREFEYRQSFKLTNNGVVYTVIVNFKPKSKKMNPVVSCVSSNGIHRTFSPSSKYWEKDVIKVY